GVEQRGVVDARLSFFEIRPQLRDIVAERGDAAHAGDDDAPSHDVGLFRFAMQSRRGREWERGRLEIALQMSLPLSLSPTLPFFFQCSTRLINCVCTSARYG